jgi:hypothetical protein
MDYPTPVVTIDSRVRIAAWQRRPACFIRRALPVTSKAKLLTALAVCLVSGGTYGTYRLTSCVWGARDVSGLPLHGHFTTVACTPFYAMDTHIVLKMDSATAAAVDRAAARDPKYRRLEDLPAFDGGGHPNALSGKHGWYIAVQYINNGGHTVVIDS